jgi:excinuclease ABC subunit B
MDPVCEVRPATNQVDDLLDEVRTAVASGFRVLITTLTKRMAEDLTDYYREIGVNVRYLHSEIDTIERTAILRDLRMGRFDVLVGINLLREGLDLPEVGLVAILDADKEGFLRNHKSLIQTIGRAARNAEGRVILYADRMTDSMRIALDETERRRAKQKAYNEQHGIVPKTVVKAITDLEQAVGALVDDRKPSDVLAELERAGDKAALERRVRELKDRMRQHAEALEFEKAAEARDELKVLERMLLAVG